LLGKSLLRQGQYQAAAEQFEILGNDVDATVAYYLGLSRLGADDCALALPALARAVELGPLYRPALEAYARAGASCPAADSTTRARALELAQGITRSANDTAAQETLAMALAANGRFEDAVEIQSALGKAAPKDVFVRENLDRYRARNAAVRAWPEGHSVFAPKRVSTYNR
jgi:cytochrome c-type biogenesis protein CcmH/NrfG